MRSHLPGVCAIEAERAAARPRPFLRHRLLAILLLTAAGAAPADARELPAVEPAAVGLSAERLAWLDTAISRTVAADEIAGAVVLVARRGKLAHLGAYGHAGRPMRADTLFRIASMTKPVTSVAVMMLYEEGLLLLDDPVGRYLPAFDREMQVAVPVADGYQLVPAKSRITVRHLLTHTSGISYRFMGLEPLSRLYAEAGITDGLGADIPGDELVARLAGLGFSYDPGPSGSGQIGSTGVVGWGGFFNTDAFFDPEEDLVAVLMTQHYPYGIRLLAQWRPLVYQAIVD